MIVTERNIVPPLLKWAFAVHVFSIPFESVDSFGKFISVSKWFGLVVMLIAMLYPRLSFRRPSYVVWLFVLYVATYFISGIFQDPELYPDIYTRGFTILQMVLLLWVAQNLLGDDATVHLTFLSLGISTFLISILQVLGISSVAYAGKANRISAFGEDPNSFAAVLALGFLSLLALAFFSEKRSNLFRLAVMPMLALILAALIGTGSRTGLLGLFLGVLILPLHKQPGRSYFVNVAIVVAALLGLYFAVSSNTSAMQRLQMSFLEGNLAKREKILPAAWSMVQEKPLAGWGPFTNFVELGRRVNFPMRDPHNLFLLILTEVGLIGGVPYFLGLAGSAYKAWKARGRLNTIMPLVLLACLLMVNSGISWHNRKLHWLVLAYCVASYPLKKAERPMLTFDKAIHSGPIPEYMPTN